MVLSNVPTLAEMIDILTALNKYDQLQINDMSVSVFNSMYSLSNLVAPIIGALLYNYIGYEFTCNIMAFSSIAFALIFYLTMILKITIKKLNE